MSTGWLNIGFYGLFLAILLCAGKEAPAFEGEKGTYPLWAAVHPGQGQPRGELRQGQKEQAGFTVGALYYIWWGLLPGERNMWKHGHSLSPILGEYSSSDPSVAERHIKWATEHGISLFEVSWSGPGKRGPELDNDEIDAALREGLLAAPSIKDLKFLLVYETERALVQEAQEMGYNNIKEAFIEDILYAVERYFDHPSYFKLDGRPVVMVWKVKDILENLLEEEGFELQEALSEAEKRAHRDIFWVSLGEDVYRSDGPPADDTTLSALDAVTPLLGDMFPAGEVKSWQEYLGRVEAGYGLWNTKAGELGFMFIPSIIPGFDDRAFNQGQNRLLEMDPKGFYQAVLLAKGGHGNWISIYGFNEWFESGVIEPTNEFGLQFLDTLKEALRD